MSVLVGVDEVGRGPLAGPVVTCAVLWPDDPGIAELDDSKKLSQNYEVISCSTLKENKLKLQNFKSIENLNSEEKFKLSAGEIIIYPSTYLHSVEEVLDGERLVFIGWIESYVKSIEEREYLFDLDAAARSLLAKYGRSNEVDLIFKSYSNLLRRLGS